MCIRKSCQLWLGCKRIMCMLGEVCVAVDSLGSLIELMKGMGIAAELACEWRAYFAVNCY
jgi:hypothetical protein